MSHFFTRTGLLIKLVVGFCLLLIGLVWLQLFHQLDTDRTETIKTSVKRNNNLAVALEQYAIRTIKSADMELKAVKMEYEKEGKGFDMNALLRKGVIDLKAYRGLVILDDNGNVISSNLYLEAGEAFSFPDRSYFTFHTKHNEALFISQPLQSATVNAAVIVLSRRIDKPDGSFGGVIAILIAPATFTQFYAKANLLDHDIISLIAPDGSTYARRTGNRESYGENISRSPLFGYVARDPVSNYMAKDAIRGIPTYFSYRKLEDYPIIATVGRAESDVLASYYDRARRDVIYTGIVTLLVLFFCALVCAVLVHRRNNLRKLQDSEARYRSIFENSYDGIVLLHPNGQVQAMNGAAHQLFKVSVGTGAQVNFPQLFAHSDPFIAFPPDPKLKEAGTGREIRFTLLDGSTFIGEIACSEYSDFSGQDHLVINIRDITLRRQMEQQLLREQKRFQRRLTRQIILAQERERESIGHELHDNVNQILTTVKLYLEMAWNNPDTREQLLPKSIKHVMNCITEIRNLSHALSAPTLGTRSLIDSVTALLEMVASSTGLTIHFIHDSYQTPVHKDQKLAIYRILQEQLNNIIKHAKATVVTVTIAQCGNNTVVRISDNGRGFDVNAKGNGIGLMNMVSRVKVFGGEMNIDTAKGKGCDLQVSLPILTDEEVAVEEEEWSQEEV